MCWGRKNKWFWKNLLSLSGSFIELPNYFSGPFLIWETFRRFIFLRVAAQVSSKFFRVENFLELDKFNRIVWTSRMSSLWILLVIWSLLVLTMSTTDYPVTPPHLPTGDDAKTPPPGGKPNPNNRPSSPDPNCAICLGELDNMSYTDSCFHKFCFLCLKEWSKVNIKLHFSMFSSTNLQQCVS